jgi:hypothetical protein
VGAARSRSKGPKRALLTHSHHAKPQNAPRTAATGVQRVGQHHTQLGAPSSLSVGGKRWRRGAGREGSEKGNGAPRDARPTSTAESRTHLTAKDTLSHPWPSFLVGGNPGARRGLTAATLCRVYVVKPRNPDAGGCERVCASRFEACKRGDVRTGVVSMLCECGQGVAVVAGVCEGIMGA